MTDWIVFYAVSAVFQPYNGSISFWINLSLILKIYRVCLFFSFSNVPFSSCADSVSHRPYGPNDCCWRSSPVFTFHCFWHKHDDAQTVSWRIHCRLRQPLSGHSQPLPPSAKAYGRKEVKHCGYTGFNHVKRLQLHVIDWGIQEICILLLNILFNSYCNF